jgi:hypothetical protein
MGALVKVIDRTRGISGNTIVVARPSQTPLKQRDHNFTLTM